MFLFSLTAEIGDGLDVVGAVVLLVRRHVADLGDGNLFVLAVLARLAVHGLRQHLRRDGSRGGVGENEWKCHLFDPRERAANRKLPTRILGFSLPDAARANRECRMRVKSQKGREKKWVA